ncbi:MAG: L,D-transpeptidase [Desulfobaccales bacterium]
MPGVNAYCCYAACVRFELRPLSPEHITSNFGSRTLDNAKLKEFLETKLNRKFFNWPASSWDFSMLTLTALYSIGKWMWPRLSLLASIQNKRKLMKAILLLSGAAISLLLWSPSVRAQDMEQSNPIYNELAEQRRMTTGDITIVYGVPCVEVILETGESIMTFVHSIPSLKKKSLIVQDRIALLNRTHYLLVVNGSGNISTDKNIIFVPLDYSIEPKILPEFLPGAANHEKYILIDRRQQYLGLYEWGNLQYCYPISSGTSNSTPLKKFVVSHMDETHNSTLYDQAPMDHALNIGNAYFIHEGIVPGYPASHGCIRVFPLHARFLFYQWAKPGIPGKITD